MQVEISNEEIEKAWQEITDSLCELDPTLYPEASVILIKKVLAEITRPKDAV